MKNQKELKEKKFKLALFLYILECTTLNLSKVITKFQFLKLANLGVVINDLQRSKIAYRLFEAYSRVFMKSKMARHDGLISIERAFTKNELLSFTSKLGVQSFNIKWRWAFRYLWILENQK